MLILTLLTTWSQYFNMERYKVNVEIHSPGDGRIFINYWNWRNGDDVVCELIDGKIIHSNRVDDVEKNVEITIGEFIKMVEDRII